MGGGVYSMMADKRERTCLYHSRVPDVCNATLSEEQDVEELRNRVRTSFDLMVCACVRVCACIYLCIVCGVITPPHVYSCMYNQSYA